MRIKFNLGGQFRNVVRSNYACLDCKHVGRMSGYCSNCGKELQHVGDIARAPRKDASNKQWKRFGKYLRRCFCYKTWKWVYPEQ
jgi:predicted amidophosphoribosyltransferase